MNDYQIVILSRLSHFVRVILSLIIRLTDIGDQAVKSGGKDGCCLPSAALLRLEYLFGNSPIISKGNLITL